MTIVIASAVGMLILWLVSVQRKTAVEKNLKIFCVLVFCILFSSCGKDDSIGIIGGADGIRTHVPQGAS